MTRLIDQYRQTMPRDEVVPWHSHHGGYAAVVLEGGYVEAGDGGRRRAETGHVVIHPPFHAHRDWVGAGGAEVVNLPLPLADALDLRSGAVRDPHEILRAIADDPHSAGAILRGAIGAVERERDLPDLLAAALDEAGDVSLTRWAARHGVSRRTVTRQFVALYGITPAHYRLRTRTFSAWRAILAGDRSLARIAHETGFADQAHMSRAVRAFTGRTPSRWGALRAPVSV